MSSIVESPAPDTSVPPRVSLPEGSAILAPPDGPPELPVLTLRVGITGHRNLDPATRERVRTAVYGVLARIESVVAEVAANPDAGYAREPARLVAISPLAEGADRIFANAALSRRWELHVPMPFAQAEYEVDFPASLDEFRALVGSAKRTLELDGTRAAAELAYLRVGETTLHQSDVLIAVWDSEPADKIGGTAQIVDEAWSHRVPIVWIDVLQEGKPPREGRPPLQGEPLLLSAPPHEGAKGDRLDPALPQRLKELLLPPHLQPAPPATQVHHPDWMERLRIRIGGATGRLGPDTYYRGVRMWPRNPPFFRWFRSAVMLGAPKPVASQQQTPPLPWRDYQWADVRATHHAHSYRSAFTITYVFGALAVLLALVGSQLEHLPAKIAVASELVLTLVAMAVVVFAWRGRWHDLWLDERLLAERFRQLYILQPLALSAPGTRVQRGDDDPEFSQYGSAPNELWATWLFRAHVRAIGMPKGSFGPAQLRQYREQLLAVLREQASYHHANNETLHTLRHRLHLWGLTFFVGTLGICLTHLLVPEDNAIAKMGAEGLLVVLAGALPALASATAGIIGHGEFQRLARNSYSTHQRLTRLITDLEKSESATSHSYAATADDAAQLMLSELLAWHVLISERPLHVG
jgi:hypothetical protein